MQTGTRYNASDPGNHLHLNLSITNTIPHLLKYHPAKSSRYHLMINLSITHTN